LNDKTLVPFDEFIMGLKTGEQLDNLHFELYDYDSNGNVVKKKYCGAWLLIDNSYHQWSITVLPFKRMDSRAEICFSTWLESMQKDAECTFGILKGCWHILKARVCIHGHVAVDHIWSTCIALHNMLLEVDGLDECWSAGIASNWQGNLGLYDEANIPCIPRPIYCLNNPKASCNYDTSSSGLDKDFSGQQSTCRAPYQPPIAANVHQEILAVDGSHAVYSLTLNQFHDKLACHFNIAFKKREIQWPSRTGVAAPNV
jgi:hypothetical protein